jgi:hypothetical protein
MPREQDTEVNNMIFLGLLVLLAAGGLAVSGITARNGGSPARSGLLGDHLHGPGSRLVFFGLVLAAAAMLGLATMVTRRGRGFTRHPASRQPLRGSRQKASAPRQRNGQLSQ